MIRIAEIFHSVQGEGQLTGTPSIFVRTSGCNLRCWFCDTRYASWEPEGESLEISKIVEQASRWETDHVVITGGEPMIFEEIGQLARELKSAGKHITVETAGTVFRDMACDLWSISPKLSNSTPIGFASEQWIKQHDERRLRPEVVESMMVHSDYQLKFVVGSILDAEEVLEYLTVLKGWNKEKVMMMPRGTSVEELQLQSSWLADWCRHHGFRFCDRQHIYWYGNTRGT